MILTAFPITITTVRHYVVTQALRGSQDIESARVDATQVACNDRAGRYLVCVEETIAHGSVEAIRTAEAT